MNVLMFTNTYSPHVGGVARAVQTLRDTLKSKCGVNAFIVAPEYQATPVEAGVLRVPSVPDAKGSGFSLPLVPTAIVDMLWPYFKAPLPFALIHSHHPFSLGDTALTVARNAGLPLVFTYHTMYEQLAHYVSTTMEQTAATALIIKAATYCNCCDAVIAPSKDVVEVLRSRRVRNPITVIPTGIDLRHFERGNRERFRTRYGIPFDKFVIGYVGRLSKEKNLGLLDRAAKARPSCVFVVVGSGPEADQLKASNIILTGSLSGQELVDVYHGFDLFAFPSTSETQGLVLVEALAAGCPVLGIKSPGVSDVVINDYNGFLVVDASEFLVVLQDGRLQQKVSELARHTKQSVVHYGLDYYGVRVAELYRDVLARRLGCSRAVGC